MTINKTHFIKTRNEQQKGVLADQVAASLRERIIKGFFRPGEHLSEPHLCDELAISRNTLREGFRLLVKEGLLLHRPNRGVFVTTPDPLTIIDVYNVRRVVECQAVLYAHPFHQAVEEMRKAVELAQEMRIKNEWLQVGSADIQFHGAIVKFADSPRLSAFFEQILAQLRLVFGLINDPQRLHAPFIDRNAKLLELIENGDVQNASQELKFYFDQAQQFIMTAYAAYLQE